MSYSNETRSLRNRLSALESARDRAPAGGPAFKSARILVKVVDDGNQPTASDHYWATVPCEADSVEEEGAAPTFDCDEGSRVYVDFLGVPQTGDMAVATAVGGRWVAEIGGSTTTGCQGCSTTIRTVTLSWTAAPDAGQCGFGHIVGDGSVPFRIWDADTERCDNGGPTLCTNSIGPAHAALLCDGVGHIQLNVANSCPDSTQNCSIAPDPGFTCSPILMTFTVPPSAGWCYSFWRTFTITE